MNPVLGPLTTDFHETRPLWVVEELKKPGLTAADAEELRKKLHVHGALDVGAVGGAPIRAPEKGMFFYWAAYRREQGKYWPRPNQLMPGGRDFPYHNYFYDTYGGVIVVVSTDDKRVHLICHSYANQLFNKQNPTRILTLEEHLPTRFPIHATYTYPERCEEGQIIGAVGNAGYSTGPHVHWEIHRGWQWERWEDRIDPDNWQ